MSETNKNSSIDSTADIQIIGLNRDKTRKTNGSTTEYQVYFELSGTPSQSWRNIFEAEWKVLAPPSRSGNGTTEANITGNFLVLHSSLMETATHLAVLKLALTETNVSYKHYLEKQATEQEQKEDVWKQERKEVDVMAESLHFN